MSDQSEQLYVVHWRVKETGFSGHGKPMVKSLAEAWAKEENRKMPDVHHWIEPAAPAPKE